MCSKLAMITELFEKTVVNSKCYNRNLRNVKLVSCSDGVVISELQIGPEHLNEGGTLHGAFIGHLVDTLSTFVLLAHNRAVGCGLSLDLGVSSSATISEGDKLEIEAVVQKVGNRIAFLDVQIRNKEKDKLIAKGITWPVDRPEEHVQVWTDLDQKRCKFAQLSPSNSIAQRVVHANLLESLLGSQGRTQQDDRNDE